MTTYYVGPGGNDGNSGLTWALRKLTLNGVEDIPVAAGDTVYVGPGVYRETLVIDVTGTPGNRITYIGDVSGENTDGIGGIVRITGSDDDQTATRVSCISSSSERNYRTFRGFCIDFTTGSVVRLANQPHRYWIIEDCYFQAPGGTTIELVNCGDLSEFIVRRCEFLRTRHFGTTYAIQFINNTEIDDQAILVENCIFIEQDRTIGVDRIGGVTIKNCTFLGNGYACRQDIAPNLGQTINMYNNIIVSSFSVALQASALGIIIEDYNTFFNNNSDRTNVDVGINSVTYPALFNPLVLLDGFKYPESQFQLSEWSPVARQYDAYDEVDVWGIYAGISVTEDDLLGIYRPVGVYLKSWGALQLREGEREATTVRTGDASIILDSAGDHQIFVPVTNVSTTFEVYVYREANYDGLAPQMIIRQPGQEDEVVTDTGAAGAWNQLTKTLTPAADPPYVCVILRSHNTALSGNYNVFFDDLDVS